MDNNNGTSTHDAELEEMLAQAGFDRINAVNISDYFNYHPEFLNDLDIIASKMAGVSNPSGNDPSCEPWLSIWGVLGTCPDVDKDLPKPFQEVDDAFMNSLEPFSKGAQTAIHDIIVERVDDFSDQKQANKFARAVPPPKAKTATPPPKAKTAASPPKAKTAKRKGKYVSKAEYEQVLQNMGYDFKINLCTDCVEVNGDPISDTLEKEIYVGLREKGYYYVNHAENVWVAYARKNSYHPIKDYLNGLTHDGGNYISQLVGYFDNPDGTFGTFLKRWLIGAVRRVLEDGTQNRMLVLEGPQTIGKSLFVKWLCPEKLRGRHYYEGPINPDNKDHKLLMMERWIWEVGEFGSTARKADREALKFFLTIGDVTERAPYHRYPITKPAMTSFIGTLNNEGGVLTDPTGSRRFMFSRIENVDWEGYIKNLTPDQIWAETMVRYLAREPADLTPDEIKLADKSNEVYEKDNPIEGFLYKHFEVDRDKINDPDWFTTTEEILTNLLDPQVGGYKSNTTQAGRELAALMTKLGCKRGRASIKSTSRNKRNQPRGYQGVKRI